MIGSGNLTEGGLFTNYEAGLDVALDLSAAGDAAVLDSIEEALDAWADLASGVASQLDEELLDSLTELGLVPSEAALAARTERTDSPDGGPGRSDESPFAARSEARAPTPPSPGIGGRRPARHRIPPTMRPLSSRARLPPIGSEVSS